MKGRERNEIGIAQLDPPLRVRALSSKGVTKYIPLIVPSRKGPASAGPQTGRDSDRGELRENSLILGDR